MSHPWRRLWALPLLAAALIGVASAEGEATPATASSEQASAAEALLFETHHLADLALPTQLQYRFSWSGDSSFEDRILLSIDKTGRAEVDYLSGERHVGYPAVEAARGNPLLLFFLEHDLREMQRQTGGSANYFRRLVRRALADPGLATEAVTASVAGRPVAASRLLIEPYAADPMAAARYPRLAGKRYEFVLSPAVPGQIVSLTIHIPAADGLARTAKVEWTGNTPL